MAKGRSCVSMEAETSRAKAGLLDFDQVPGNFRPAPDTITAVREVMQAAGVKPPAEFPKPPQRNEYSSDNKPQRPEPGR